MSDEKKALLEEEYELPEQDHEKGPGWFLILSYVVIVAFMVYYLFTYWDWQSDYDVQQKQLQEQIVEPN